MRTRLSPLRSLSLGALVALASACSPRPAPPGESVAADASATALHDAPPSAASAASSDAPDAATTTAAINPRLLRRFQPLPAASPLTSTPAEAAKVALGRQLFFESRLSAEGDLSCNSCHALDRYGMDGAVTSTGRHGAHGTRNAPTVLNAAGHFAQFWDGRAATVEAQAAGPILDPVEMGSTREGAVRRLREIPEYVAAFAGAFPGKPDAVTFDHIGEAIGAFERTLVVPGRWDRYLEGDRGALSSAEVEGLRVFLNAGCMVCHTGAYLGGSMFARLGAVIPWPNTRDEGRMTVTRSAADRMMFKVPSLRNIEKTAPYFHDGSASTLEAAVQLMGHHQLGVELEPGEIAAIVTWLRSLTSPLPAELVARPPLPGPAAASAAADERADAHGPADAPPLARPLQAWMRREAAPALRQEDAPRLARAFVDLARFAPPGYPDWVTHATRGGEAARAGDVEGARDACDDCHTQYRERYRAELRPRPLP